eukprot:6095786-Alexandrium_andersonii.AAC.1
MCIRDRRNPPCCRPMFDDSKPWGEHLGPLRMPGQPPPRACSRNSVQLLRNTGGFGAPSETYAL